VRLGHSGAGWHSERRQHAGLSKLNSMQTLRGLGAGSQRCALTRSVDIPSPDVLRTLVNSRFNQSVRLAGLNCPTDSGCSLRSFPRKEVIQPQLPLRLPCYDFTPVTSPTFDGSLPCGLGHRLRVLLTPMV
jgi:hypothetical protein